MSFYSTCERPAHILAVDDNPDVGLGIKDLLELEGHTVEVVGTGEEALQRIHATPCDVVILDICLPDQDGLSLLHSIVQTQPSLPVILLTALHALDRKTGPLEHLGAFAYITKPYDGKLLKTMVRRALNAKALATSAQQALQTLHASEERFRAVIQAATDAVVLADHQGTIVSWNPAAHRLFGYSEEEVLGKPLHMIMPTRYREAHERGLQRVSAGEACHVIGKVVELEGLRKDGTEFPLELSVSTWRTETERFFCGIIRDSTQRKRAERVLREANEQYRCLVEGVHAIPWEMDYRTGRMTYIGPQAISLLGYPVEQWFTPQFWETHLHPEDRTQTISTCKERARHERWYQLEYRMVDAKGQVVWIQDFVSVTLDADGQPSKLHGLMLDITERKHTEEFLKKTHGHMAIILANLPVSIFILNQDHRIVYANASACHSFQHTDVPLRGQLIHECLPLAATQWNRLVARVFLDATPSSSQEDEFEIEQRSFRYCLFPLPTSPNSKEDQQFGRFGVMAWDITEKKQLQEQLIQTEKLSSLGTLISGMAHEISNPMQAVVGISELLAEESDPDNIQELTTDLRRAALHISAILRDFMAYARPGSHDQDGLTDINEQLRRAAKMVKRSPYFGQTEVKEHFKQVPPIQARSSEIEQIFLNLMSNAVQAMNSHGELHLSTSANEQGITVQIRDTGEGIPETLMTKIFDPFFTTKKHGVGTGLGLSIVQKLISKYAGSLQITSTQGKGTTATIVFPYKRASIE